ncbi:YdcF family protein [Chondromyces crocatus]|nr:YdcF family protein [Chondromyces crocatus]
MATPLLPRVGLMIPVFRGFALVVCAFTLINAVRAVVSRGASVAWHLFQLPGVPGGADVCLAILAVVLGWSAFGPVRRRAVAVALAVGLLALAALAVQNALTFGGLVRAGTIRSGFPLPLSAGLAGALLLHGGLCLWPRHVRARANVTVSPRAVLTTTAAALAWVGGAVVLHIHAFGLTDYRRPADAIVVFGARAYADGTPSEALAERVLTGVSLYKAGLSPRIVMSGGVDPSGVSEPVVMRELALRAGVPDEAIVLDELGASTEASVTSVGAMAARLGVGRVLAVSHYFHLARIKLLFERSGMRCFTVPADEGATLLRGTPYYVLREVAGLAFYFTLG